MAKTRIRLLVVEDHAIIRESLRLLLLGTDVEIVGEAGTLQQALQLVDELIPDVILLDLRLPDGDGFAVLEYTHDVYPDIAVVIHSAHYRPELTARSEALGARGFFSKGTSGHELVAALRNAPAE